MVKTIGRNTNVNDTAIISDAIALNETTSVKIADVNPNRIFFYVTNNGSSDAVWVKLQAAAVDNDKKGIWVEKKEVAESFWQMPVDNIYTGEISAISNSSDPDVYVTEY